jgi:hypothetical protein
VTRPRLRLAVMVAAAAAPAVRAPHAGAAPTSAPALRAPAPSQATATFALIIGVNASLDPELAPLRYADDDAARYLDLFRALGARTYLLARLDEDTRPLHAQAAAEAQPPRAAELARATEALARDVAQARARGVKTVLHVVYAGHGNVEEAGAYLTLEDRRLGGDELIQDVVRRAGADQSHLVIDACHAYLLAFPRGPGGERRPVRGFIELEAAARTRSVGVLLSSSASGEAHEWAGFQAGVFSHEVRSGLYGAADADGDGRVTYTEIAAFVSRANEAIASARYRPRVLARPARGDGGDVLVDLRGRRDRALRLDGAAADGHQLIEDERGVRVLDVHAAAAGHGAPVTLMRPAVAGPLYLRRLADGVERVIPPSDGPVAVSALPAEPARVHGRGAAHHAFGRIFALPFDAAAVEVYARRQAADATAVAEAERQWEDERARARAGRVAGWSAIGAGAAAAVAGGAFVWSAHAIHDGEPAGESQRDAVARNDRIARHNFIGSALLIGGAAAVAGGVGLLLWSRTHREPSLTLGGASTGGGGWHVGATWRF